MTSGAHTRSLAERQSYGVNALQLPVISATGRAMNQVSRRTALGVLALGAVFGAGCMTKPLRPANADGSYCFATGKSYRRSLTCTAAPIPSEQVEAAAKRFEAVPGMLTVYVVRKRWADAANVVGLVLDARPRIVTVPESFVRLRLKPGSHSLIADWAEGRRSMDFTGAAGEVLFVELIGSAWTWGSNYRLERGDPAESRARVTAVRMVADVG